MREAAALEAAYDDALGVAAAFNRTILRDGNRLIGADFVPGAWRHVALWQADPARIEMHLEALHAQTVRWPGGARHYAAGGRIRTEMSTKWTVAGLAALYAAAGFAAPTLSEDPQSAFAVAPG